MPRGNGGTQGTWRDWKYSSIKNPTTTAGVVGPHDKPSTGDDVNLQRDLLVAQKADKPWQQSASEHWY